MRSDVLLVHYKISLILFVNLQISVGDIVSCADEDGDIAIGTIMDIEDDLGRLHVKVTKYLRLSFNPHYLSTNHIAFPFHSIGNTKRR